MTLAHTTAGLFVVSSMFPIVAGLSRDTSGFSRWWGITDVALALALAVMTILVVARAERKVTPRAIAASYRIYRVLLHGLLVGLVVFFLAGDRIVWANCLAGFGWRAWLLLYALPAWLTELESARSVEAPGI